MATGTKWTSTVIVDSIKTTPEVIVNSDKSRPIKVFDSQSLSPSEIAQYTAISGHYSAGIVTVSATYDSSATSGVRIRWLYSPNGSLFDSPEDAINEGNYKDLTFSAGETRTRTIIIPFLQPYVRVQIVNLDSSCSVTIDCYHTYFK